MRAKLSKPEKNLILSGHVFFIIFLFLTALLYRERVMVADCAFQVFHIIRTGSFAIYHNRFSPFISQLLPLAAVHAKLPLNVVLVIYSVSVPLMSYVFYGLAAHVLKDYRAAVAIALAACMVLTQGFYFAPFELNQAVSLLILLFAFLQLHRNF
ncbi:MAG TPA: hypothetical protein VK927_02165, partial [Adhaeribacter sp.]|nr:hypothetical protein [Adhaeribacter sp.]